VPLALVLLPSALRARDLAEDVRLTTPPLSAATALPMRLNSRRNSRPPCACRSRSQHERHRRLAQLPYSHSSFDPRPHWLKRPQLPRAAEQQGPRRRRRRCPGGRAPGEEGRAWGTWAGALEMYDCTDIPGKAYERRTLHLEKRTAGHAELKDVHLSQAAPRQTLPMALQALIQVY